MVAAAVVGYTGVDGVVGVAGSRGRGRGSEDVWAAGSVDVCFRGVLNGDLKG